MNVETVLLLFILLLLIMVMLVTLTGMTLLLIGTFITRIPFVPVPKKLLPHIVSALGLESGSVLYDIGSGDGRVVFAALNVAPNARVTGIEIAPLPHLIALYKRFMSSQRKANLVRGNALTYSYADATHVFSYMLPIFMKKLLPKLERELPKGARVVSCDFPFVGRNPEHTEKIQIGKRVFTLYTYEF